MPVVELVRSFQPGQGWRSVLCLVAPCSTLYYYISQQHARPSQAVCAVCSTIGTAACDAVALEQVPTYFSANPFVLAMQMKACSDAAMAPTTSAWAAGAAPQES
jgi:hypothetical protein